VSDRVTGMLHTDSDYLKAAQTFAKQKANTRGMLNTSMAVGAGTDAAIKSVLPIASQEADLASKSNIAQANIASNDREKAMAAAVQMANNYAESFKTIVTDPNMPADARRSYQNQLLRTRDNNFALIEQMYGITLDWGSSGSGGGTPLIPAPAAPASPAANHPGVNVPFTNGSSGYRVPGVAVGAYGYVDSSGVWHPAQEDNTDEGE
jgi:hypothetical protein